MTIKSGVLIDDGGRRWTSEELRTLVWRLRRNDSNYENTRDCLDRVGNEADRVSRLARQVAASNDEKGEVR